MKNRKVKVFVLAGTFLAVFMQLHINIDVEENNADIELNMSSMKAAAQDLEEEGNQNCLAFGARNWNQANSFKDGYDCLCKPRKKVTGNCNPE